MLKTKPLYKLPRAWNSSSISAKVGTSQGLVTKFMAAKGLIVRGSTGKWEVTPDGADYWVKANHGNAGNGTLTWTDKIFEVFEDFREWDANRKA